MKSLGAGGALDHRNKELTQAGLRLIAARSEEAALSARARKRQDDEILFAQWARARQQLEECQQDYLLALETSGFQEAPIRTAVEGESGDAQ